MLKTDHGFSPEWASAPGETILDLLANGELANSDFARLIGLTDEAAADLLAGELRITLGLARRISLSIGGSARFWMSRDHTYQADRERLSARLWLDTLPMNDMVRFGWFTSEDPIDDPARRLFEWFGVDDLESWHEKFGAMPALRRSVAYPMRKNSLAAWIRRGEIEAAGIQCGTWSHAALRTAVSATRRLTRQRDPLTFIPELRKLFAQAGVAVVIAQTPSGCPASGASLFLNPTKAMLVLSFRHLSDDHFWFTLFHEAGHLLLDGADHVFVGDDAAERSESEASRFATETLVPAESRYEMMSLRLETRNIVRFARRIGVSPGIVVGQLQHHGRLPYGRMNSLKRRYRWPTPDAAIPERA